MNMNQGCLAIFCGLDIHSASASFYILFHIFRYIYLYIDIFLSQFSCMFSWFRVVLLLFFFWFLACWHWFRLFLFFIWHIVQYYIKWCEPLRECKWDLYPGIYTVKVDITILFKRYMRNFSSSKWKHQVFLTSLVHFCIGNFVCVCVYMFFSSLLLSCLYISSVFHVQCIKSPLNILEFFSPFTHFRYMKLFFFIVTH